ncbi:MAG: DUF4294 domain-containing protein [Bacteroidales bacterium]|nr:DUF4294 domain-containing protein [Bacteroidales bacterium]
MKRALLIAALLTAALSTLSAQDNWQERIFMRYYVEESGDTTFVDSIRPAWVFPKNARKNDPDMRKFYKLVYNFNKVYPYTAVARKIIDEVDATIEEKNMGDVQRNAYITKWQTQLLRDFEDIIRHMTISQGQLLCRLVDREIGMTSYNIVKVYKNGFAAGFWQGVARLFGQNLKTPYDPKGEDRMTEYLIMRWEEGSFDSLYYSLFWEWPVKTVVPEKYR